MKMTGIYKIQSKIKPERIYIGSAVNIVERKRLHLLALHQKKHHSGKLQNHYNHYGKDDLIFSIIVECNKLHLIAIEQFYIDSLNPFFNICKIAGSRLGVKATENTRNKLKESLKCNKNHYGKIHTKDTRDKISRMKIGKSPWNKGIKGKQVAWNKGIKNQISEETRIKMSLKKIGHIPWNKGIEISDETKKKISEANKGKIPHNKKIKI